MKIISHRGNIRGAVPDKENRPSYIDCAIGSGYDVEIDLRMIDGELWLGHDEPQYRIEHSCLKLDFSIFGFTVRILKQQRSVGITSINHFVMLVTPIHILQQERYGCMICL